MRIILVLFMLIMMPFSASADGILKMPRPDLAPIDVVRIQLEALQQNDTPKPDFGIEQTWAFAHPENRAVTGPLDRFAQMIRNPAYIALIDHQRHTITEQNRSTKWVQFKVLMEDQDGRVLAFSWVVKKAKTLPFEDCWMTSSVSAPVLAGQGS